MKKIKVAINGFGRIGRQFFKVANKSSKIEIVAINDLASLDNLAYLLEYDSVYGRYDKKVKSGANKLTVGNKNINFFSKADPAKLPWKKFKVDVVVEATGHFTSYEEAKAHLDAGAKRVVITAPVKETGREAITATPNVNTEALKHAKITSNASCTTNATTPVSAIMMAKIGIESAMLNTVHGYTASQKLVDSEHKDYRRGRSAGINIIPSTTGATVATAKAIPGAKDKFDGLSLRVPVATGSILDFTFVAQKKTSVKEINKIFTAEAKKPLWRGVLAVTDKPIVSSDIIGNPHGAIIDLNLTRVVNGNLVKIMAWYDNEYGYANMLTKHVIILKNLL